jgi:hypothetical protein
MRKNHGIEGFALTWISRPERSGICDWPLIWHAAIKVG